MDRFFVPIIGAPRGGKTHFSERVAESYTANGNGAVLAYNIGKHTDFPDENYTLIEHLSFNEHIVFIRQNSANWKTEIERYKMDKTVIYFRVVQTKQVYHISDFVSLFWGGRAKMYGITNRVEETAFFKSLYIYVSEILLILDDCLNIFRYGLNDSFIQLFSRQNHTGRENSIEGIRSAGMDIILIVHNIDHLPNRVLDYATAVVMLRFANEPTFDKIENSEIIAAFRGVYEHLLNAPKYTAIQVGLKDETYLKTLDVTLPN